MLTQTLQNIGFTEKEAKIYLASLELGATTASFIAEKAGLNRVTTYEILKGLAEKRVVNIFTKNNIKYFIPENPYSIIEETKRRALLAEEALPQLLSIYNTHPQKPKITFYEGEEGLKKIYKDTLTAENGILTITNAGYLIKRLTEKFHSHYIEERVKKNIQVKSITLDDQAGKKAKEEGLKVLRETRLVPKKEFNFTNEIQIYNNKVAVISCQEEPIGLIIESKEIANSFRNVFRMAWNYSEKVNK